MSPTAASPQLPSQLLPSPSTAAASGPATSPTGDPALVGSRAVSIQTPDGVVLAGRDFGDGLTAVVLAHFASPERGQTMWFSFAQVLRQHGYRALTFDFRGYCLAGSGGCSGGVFDKVESWRDIVLAADTLRRSGVTKVIVMGAGLGGHSALWAASRPGVDFAGVIAVSAPQQATGGPSSYDLSASVLRSISEPKLFIAGDGAEAEARDDARSMYGASLQPKELTLLPSSAAGPELFTQGSPEYIAHADQVVLDFLAGNG